MKKKIFSDDDVQEIIKKYIEEHVSMSKIGECFNVSRTVISRILKENNVGTDINNKHKYFANYNIFERIDNEEKAYWLGFLAADGCNYQRDINASVVINIHRKDREHLEKFKNFMNSNANIIDHIQTEGFSNNTPMSKIILNSKKMSQDLEKLGIVPRKSLILKPPLIDSKYYMPFILGYFDGDGSIYKTSENKIWGISFEGTKEILEWIKENLEWDTTLSKRYQDDKNNYCIRCGGVRKPYTLLNKMYNSCNIHLDRKYKLYKELEAVVL